MQCFSMRSEVGFYRDTLSRLCIIRWKRALRLNVWWSLIKMEKGISSLLVRLSQHRLLCFTRLLLRSTGRIEKAFSIDRIQARASCQRGLRSKLSKLLKIFSLLAATFVVVTKVGSESITRVQYVCFIRFEEIKVIMSLAVQSQLPKM
jgi:hypothetical protein